MTVKSAGTDESHIRPGEVQVPLPAADRRLALFHRPHPHALDGAQGLPEERPRLPGIRGGLHHRGRSALAAGPARGRDLLAPDRALLDGPGAARPRGPGRPSNTATASRPFRCARRCGPIRSRSPWSSFARSRATRFMSSASTASTARRCSTSSPISPRPTPSPTPASAGTPIGPASQRLDASVSDIRSPARELSPSRGETHDTQSIEPFPRLPRPMVRTKGEAMINLRSILTAAAIRQPPCPRRPPPRRWRCSRSSSRSISRRRPRAYAPVEDRRHRRAAVASSSARSSATDPRGARHRRDRYAQHLPLSRARQRPGAPLRHRRRPRGLHLGRHQDRREEGRVAGLASAAGDDRAPALSAALHGRRPRQPARRPRHVSLAARSIASTAPTRRTTIGQRVSSGCIRLTNEDVSDLYKRVTVGAKVVVLPMTGPPGLEPRRLQHQLITFPIYLATCV